MSVAGNHWWQSSIIPLISVPICDKYIDIFDLALFQSQIAFNIDLVNILDSFVANDSLSLLATEGKTIIIAETMHTSDVINYNKLLQVSDSFNSTEFVGRVIPILETLTATETITLTTAIIILETAGFTDLANIIRELKDSFGFTDEILVNTLINLQDSASLIDAILDLIKAHPVSEQATFGEMISIKKSFTTEPTFHPPDDISEVVKDKFVEIRNPKRIN